MRRAARVGVYGGRVRWWRAGRSTSGATARVRTVGDSDAAAAGLIRTKDWAIEAGVVELGLCGGGEELL